MYIRSIYILGLDNLNYAETTYESFHEEKNTKILIFCYLQIFVKP